MKKLLSVILLCVLSVTVYGQGKNVDQDEYDEDYEFPEYKSINLTLGVGLGMDYGGIGAKLTFSPSKPLEFFGGVGWNIVGVGLNGGLTYRFMADKRVNPYLMAMYGYNAVIFVDGMKSRNETYYGPTVGGGIQLHLKSRKYWNFGILLPFRSSEYDADFDIIKNDPNITIESTPLPIGITVGFHFPL
jgi:hypothetical protein